MVFKNWQEKEHYQYTHEHTLKMWAWEFLRRHPEYKSYWEEKVSEYLSIRKQLIEKGLKTNKPSYAPGLLGLGNSPAPLSLASAISGGFASLAASQKPAGDLGLGSLLADPTPPPGYSSEITVDMDDDIEPTHSHFCIVIFSATEKWGVSYLHAPENDEPLMFKYHEDTRVFAHDKISKIYPSQNEVVIKINLNKVIKSQLSKYKAKLEAEQIKRKEKVTVIKIRPNVWQTYLRILDSNAEDRLKRKIAAEIIFPKVSNSLERYNTGLQRAKELMNGEYKKWL